MTVRVGVDVGGTFTDIVVFDESRGTLNNLKVASTPDHPEEAVLEGTSQLLDSLGVSPAEVKFFIHGTTVATNAILQARGARQALLVTKGFRDVLQIMRQDRPRLYDFLEARPRPLVPRHLRLEVDERVLYTGEVEKGLPTEDLRALIQRLARDGVRDFSVCFLHSYANPEHEREAGRMILEEVPDARVSLSSDVLPEIKEFERMSTTVVNAMVKPVIGKYVGELESSLKDMEMTSGLHLMQSNGGIMTAATARSHCVHTVLSGPAAGALSGLEVSRQAGVANMISIDVGGTSADVAVAFDGHLGFAEENDIGGHILKIPSIEIHTVGAGGGSIAWIDDGGGLQVGPQSAGAVPGPACYSRGGVDPTVTDAHLVLGRLGVENFLGGAMSVDMEKAERAISDGVADPLGLSLQEAADGIVQIANSVMVKAIRRVSVEKGYDPRESTLVAFGGAGALHACELARELQVPSVLIPPVPGVSSALGLLTADFRHDYVSTLLAAASAVSAGQLQTRFHEMKEQALVQMREEHVKDSQLSFFPLAEVRYQGQGFSLPVRFTLDELESWSGPEPLIKRFHGVHQDLYGYSDEEEPTEIVNLRLAVVGVLPLPPFKRSTSEHRVGPPSPGSHRPVHLSGKNRDVGVYSRVDLLGGQKIQGPAVIEQTDATTLILEDWFGRVDEFGNLMLERESQ